MIFHKLILHIGPHKTGTTALQSFFSENRSLLERHSLYYPRAGCIFGGHHNLAWEILLGARFNPKHGGWTQLLKELTELQEQRTIVLSSEDFSLIPVAQLSQLFQALADWDITVLCVYRPLHDFVESLHAEEVKNGRTCLSLEAFATDKIAFDQRVRMDAYLSMLIEFFGVTVKVIAYEGDVVPHVAAWLGLPPVTLVNMVQPNKRVAKDDLRRILAHRNRHCDLNWHSYFFQYVAPYLAGKATIESQMAPEESFALSKELTEVLAAHDERNIRFFEDNKGIIYDPDD